MSEPIGPTETEPTKTKKITSVEKTKDPRKVEAGKNLATVSKQAKEREAEVKRETQREMDMQKCDSDIPISGFMAVVVSAVIVGAVVLDYRSKNS